MSRANPARPTLSVIVPNYNHGRFLPESLRALATQSWPADEILVLDDASTDNSVAVIKRMAEEFPTIRLLRHEQNQGVIAGLNRLLGEARGTYVHPAAADDRVRPRFFERSMAQLVAHPEAALCSGMVVEIDEQSHVLLLQRTPRPLAEPGYLAPEQVLEHLIRDVPWISGASTIYRTELLREMGFRPELRSFTDGFAQLLLPLQHGACYVPAPQGGWRKMATGYAASQDADVDQSLDILRLSMSLMREPAYRQWFPERFLRPYEARRRFQIARQQYLLGSTGLSDEAWQQLLGARISAAERLVLNRGGRGGARRLAAELLLSRRLGIPWSWVARACGRMLIGPWREARLVR